MTIHDSDVPVKTEKGLAEMKSRSLGLPQRVRTALLLVDGVRTAGEIAGMLAASGGGGAALQSLFDAELIHIPPREAKTIEQVVATVIAAEPEEPGAVPETLLETMPQTELPEPPANVGKKRRKEVAEDVAEEKGRTKTRLRADTRLDAGPAANTRLKANGPDTRLRAHTRARRKPESNTRTRGHAAAKPAVSSAQRPDLQPGPQREKPITVSLTAQLSVPVQAPPAFLPPPPEMTLMVARAYLANELDNHLGIHGYLLKLKVMDCSSRAELEGLFDTIKKDLTDAFYIDAIDVIRHAQFILDR